MSNKSPQRTPRAIIHTRVSRDAQAENTSHGSQLAAGLKKAGELGADVVATFQEEISGALYAARPDIQESLRLIEAGEADTLIFARLDRAGRDVDNLRAVRARVEAAGAQLVFADGLNFQSGAVGNLMFTQLAGFAEFERELIRERMVGGLVAKAQSGVQPSRANSPYGYHVPKHADIHAGRYKPDEVGKYFIVEEKARWVREMFARYDRGESLNDIGRWLQSQNVPTPRGGQYWRAQVIRHILRNETYKGLAHYRKTRRIVDEKRLTEKGYSTIDYEATRPHDEWIPISAPPIVSTQLWERVNHKLETARATRSGRTDRKYALSGLLWCRHCGARMVARSGSIGKGAKRRTVSYPSYVCRNTLAYTNPDRPRCKGRYFASAALEPLVIEALLYLLEKPALLIEAGERHRSQQKAALRLVGQSTPEKRLVNLRRQLQDIEARERAAAESKIEAKLSNASTDIFDRLLTELGARRAGVAAQIERAQREAAGLDAPAAALPELPVDELRHVLSDKDVPGSEKHKLLWQFTQRTYPFGPKKRAGVDIVLRHNENEEDAPLYILRNYEGEIALRVEAKDPFPPPPAHRNTYVPEGEAPDTIRKRVWRVSGERRSPDERSVP